jgi:hypothetical protein
MLSGNTMKINICFQNRRKTKKKAKPGERFPSEGEEEDESTE